ncbi:cytochrome P450 [Auriculariales sp. MPI-PUGE-AT-0066]|nr:cytochrome P450 [Auriculariales sp. MPI-PUGE-AT-0066]
MSPLDSIAQAERLPLLALGGLIGFAAAACVVLRVVRPLLAHKDGPPTLPYWIPWHGIWYMRNARDVVDTAYRRYGSYAPFTLMLGGQTVHVVGNPQDVKTVYRLSRALSFEPITTEIVALFGMGKTSKRLRDMFSAEGLGVGHGGSSKANLIQLAHPFFRDELTSRTRLQLIGERYITELERVMDGINRRFRTSQGTKQGAPASIEVPMWNFCREAVFTASVNAMYGRSLIDKHKETFEVYNAFDEEFHKLVFQFPEHLTTEVRQNREHSSTLEDTAAEVINKWHELMLQKSGMTLREIVSGAFSIFWGFNTNSIKTSFWILVFISSTPNLVDRLRAEFAAAFSTPNGMPSIDYLTKECPLLNAVFNETLRVATAPSSMRLVEEESVVGGFVLREGERVLLPSMHLHRAKHFWGEDADEFRPDRMLEMAKTTDPVAAGYLRAFGGGSSYCPGRIFSRGEIIAFVAVMLQRYDLVMLGEPPVPNTGPPTLGVLDPPMPCGLRMRLTTRL